MAMKFTNNATSSLAANITNSATSLTVASNQGTLFPTLGAGDYFYCTLTNNYSVVEIVKVTARSSDTFTIVRGQDNTSAIAWNYGDKVELRVIAATFNDIPKLDQSNTYTALQTLGLGLIGGPWTTAGRPSSPTTGQTGYNSTLNKNETWNGSNWVASGGATGGGGDDVFYENSLIVNNSYTLSTNKNAMSVGPITIASGKSVTIPSGQRWLVF